ncbi:12510_t:CDS:2, partial [Funneliformis geosporum]
LTWNEKNLLALQIANGLNYLHIEGVLHRDLHSKNIVIHEDKAKITDFGISKVDNNQNSTIFIGIVDVYSYGVIMWEISSGYPPFENKYDDNRDLILAIACDKARESSIPNTPEKYENFIRNVGVKNLNTDQLFQKY